MKKLKGGGAPQEALQGREASKRVPHAQHKKRIEKILNICAGCKWEVAPLPGKRRSYESKTA